MALGSNTGDSAGHLGCSCKTTVVQKAPPLLLSLAQSTSGARTGNKAQLPPARPTREACCWRRPAVRTQHSRKYKLSYPTHSKIRSQLAEGGPCSDLEVSLSSPQPHKSSAFLSLTVTTLPHAPTWRQRDRFGFCLCFPCLSWCSPFRKRKGWLADSCEKGAA